MKKLSNNEKRTRINLTVSSSLKKAIDKAIELDLANNPTQYATSALREKLKQDKLIGAEE